MFQRQMSTLQVGCSPPKPCIQIVLYFSKFISLRVKLSFRIWCLIN